MKKSSLAEMAEIHSNFWKREMPKIRQLYSDSRALAIANAQYEMMQENGVPLRIRPAFEQLLAHSNTESIDQRYTDPRREIRSRNGRFHFRSKALNIGVAQKTTRRRLRYPKSKRISDIVKDLYQQQGNARLSTKVLFEALESALAQHYLEVELISECPGSMGTYRYMNGNKRKRVSFGYFQNLLRECRR